MVTEAMMKNGALFRLTMIALRDLLVATNGQRVAEARRAASATGKRCTPRPLDQLRAASRPSNFCIAAATRSAFGPMMI